MTVQSDYLPVEVPNSGVGPYLFEFDVAGADSVYVYVDNILQSSGTYTLVLNGGGPVYSGGNVTFDAPPVGSLVQIRRLTPQTQLIDLDAYEPLPAETLEYGLDKLTLLVQEVVAGELPSGAYLPLSGGTMTGPIVLSNPPQTPTYALRAGIFGENVSGFYTQKAGQGFAIEVSSDLDDKRTLVFDKDANFKLPNKDDAGREWNIRVADVLGTNALGFSSTVNGSSILFTVTSAGGVNSTWTIGADGTITNDTGGLIKGIGTPVDPTDAANKSYVDAAAGGGAVWGSITGTLSNQIDLQAALDGKAASGAENTALWGSITGTLSNQIDLQAALDAKANASNTVTTNTSQTVTGRKSFRNFLDLVNVTTTSKKFEIRCNDFGAINSLGISSSANNSNIILTASNSSGTNFSMTVGNDGQVLLPNVVTSNAAAASKSYVDTAVSDARVKQFINYDVDPSVLQHLRVCSFEYDPDAGLPLSPKYRPGIHYGVIAQQAQMFLPEAVFESPVSPDLLAFDYEMLAPLLLVEVQHLRRELEGLNQ